MGNFRRESDRHIDRGRLAEPAPIHPKVSHEGEFTALRVVRRLSGEELRYVQDGDVFKVERWEMPAEAFKLAGLGAVDKTIEALLSDVLRDGLGELQRNCPRENAATSCKATSSHRT